MTAAIAAATTVFCNVVITSILAVDRTVERGADVLTNEVAERAVDRLAGADWTALALINATSPVAPIARPCLAKTSRSRSTARLTRFWAAASEIRRTSAISFADLR